MNFKEQLGVIISQDSDGMARVVTTEKGDLLCTDKLYLTTSLFTHPVVKAMLPSMTENFVARRKEQNNDDTLTGERIDVIIHNALEGNSYREIDFNRYQDGNVCPEDQMHGVSISFFKTMDKLFKDSEIIYYFNDNKIVGVCEESGELLFISATFSMPQQQSLLGPAADMEEEAAE